MPLRKSRKARAPARKSRKTMTTRSKRYRKPAISANLAPDGKAKMAVSSVRQYKKHFFPFNGSMVPDSLYATFQWTQSYNLTNAAGTLYLYPSSLYQPDAAVSSFKPRYYNTFLGASNGTAPYLKYCVHEAIISFTAVNTSTIPIYITFSTFEFGAKQAPGSWAEASVRDDTRTMLIGAADGGNPIRRLNLKIKVKDILRKKDLKDDDNTSALYNAAPSNRVITYVKLWSADGVATTHTCSLRAQMFIKTELFEANDVAES